MVKKVCKTVAGSLKTDGWTGTARESTGARHPPNARENMSFVGAKSTTNTCEGEGEVPDALLNMEMEWADRYESGIEYDDSLPRLELLEDMTECMRVWFLTHDEGKPLQGFENRYRSMTEMIYEIMCFSSSPNKTWQAFWSWALEYFFRTSPAE